MNLAEKFEMIRANLDEQPNTIEEVESKLKLLSALMGLSAECLAEAKAELRKTELEILTGISNQLEKTPASIVTKLLAASTGEQEKDVVYADRLNSGIVHTIDALRTIISLRKAEMEQSKYQV